MHEDTIAHHVFQSGLKVHKVLGPGLLESAYEECLHYELLQHGFRVERQKGLPLVYESVRMDVGYRPDLIVEEKLIVEI